MNTRIKKPGTQAPGRERRRGGAASVGLRSQSLGPHSSSPSARSARRHMAQPSVGKIGSVRRASQSTLRADIRSIDWRGRRGWRMTTTHIGTAGFSAGRAEHFDSNPVMGDAALRIPNPINGRIENFARNRAAQCRLNFRAAAYRNAAFGPLMNRHDADPQLSR